MKKRNYYLMLRTIASLVVFALCVGMLIPAGFSVEITGNENETTNSENAPITEDPWQHELRAGDLPLDKLAEAYLDDDDLPPVIGRDLANARGHVNRLYEQEPDCYTIMFQNRDGSKTVYIFSCPVKEDLNFVAANASSLSVAESADGIGISASDNAFLNSIGNSLAAHPLFDYHIGHCELITLGNTALNTNSVNAAADITASAKEWGKPLEGARNIFALTVADVSEFETANMSDSANNNVCVSVTYSELAGEYALKHDTANKYLTNVGDALRMSSSLTAPAGKWLFEYQSNGSYTIRSQSNQGYYLVSINNTSAALRESDYGPTEWYYDTSDGRLSPNNDHTKAVSSTLSICDVASAGSWSLTNQVTYVDIVNVVIRQSGTTRELCSVFGRVGETVGIQVLYIPSNATYQAVSYNMPNVLEVDDSDSEISLLSAGTGNLTVSYKYNPDEHSCVLPVIVAPSGSSARFGGMIFDLSQNSGGQKYLALNSAGTGLTFAASTAHSSTNTTLSIKRPDDYATQFYFTAVAGVTDGFNICSVKSGKYLTYGAKNGSLSLSSATSNSTVWRVLELADGRIGICNVYSTYLLYVSGSNVRSGNGTSGNLWTPRIGGVYRLQNLSSGKYMTVEDGYDTDEGNTDNKKTVNIVTESMNSASSLSNLDSNQHFRIVYKDDIGGYLLYPICSMNGSRRVIGKASASGSQIILKNYASASLDAVDIVYSGSGSTYALKLGGLAAADSSNNVVYSSYSSTASAQKWTLAADCDRIQTEVGYANMDIDFPLSGTGFTITSGYGYRKINTSNGPQVGFHYGIDVSVGAVPLYAPFSGKVVHCDYSATDNYFGGCGNNIIVQSDQDSNLYVHFYHLSNVYVSVNDSINKGDLIGVTGNTGESYGAHLHLTFAKNAQSPGANCAANSIDPLQFFCDETFGQNVYGSTDSVGDVWQ